MFIDYLSEFVPQNQSESDVNSLLNALLHVKSQVSALQSGTSECGGENSGICYMLSELALPVELYHWTHIRDFNTIAELWPKYSGNGRYPVPSPNRNIDPETMYNITKNCWIGEYGALRIELLDWCIEYCKQWVGNSQGEGVKV